MLILWTPIARTHHANVCSCASVMLLLHLVALIVIPYWLAWLLGGFWIKEAFVRERPLVTMRHETLVEGRLADSTKVAWSTSSELNAALRSDLRPCTLRAWTEDADNNGVPELMHFKVQLPLQSSERLHAFAIIIGVDVRFNDGSHAGLRLNGSLVAQHASPLAGAHWRQRSDIVLHMREPLNRWSMREPCPSPFWVLQQPVLPDGSAADLQSISGRYASCFDRVRLCKPFLAIHHKVITRVACSSTDLCCRRGVSPLSSHHSPSRPRGCPPPITLCLVSLLQVHLAAQEPIWSPGVTEQFEALLSVNVPEIRVDYTPSSLQTLKFAWVQYLALALPLHVLLSLLRDAMVRYGIVATRLHDPLPKSRFE